MNSKYEYITQLDIAERLWYRNRFWTNKPVISLIGDVGRFGILRFDFKDTVVDMKIYICDKQHILNIAMSAINNIKDLSSKLFEMWDN